jgi:DNA replication protein DnaC
MLLEPTLDTLNRLKLFGLAQALEEQATQSAAHGLAFEERLALLLDREVLYRENRRLTRLLQLAQLKYRSASLEDVNFRTRRGLDRSQLASLGSGDWIRAGQTLLIQGATGTGKTWLGCALARQAACCGFTVLYTRTTRLLQELRVAHGEGAFGRRLAQLARVDVLLLDDFAGSPMEPGERTDLLELLDDRVGTKATLITSQLAVNKWHAWLDEPTIADAILDRIVHNSHRIELKGPSLRKGQEQDQ